MSTTTPDVLESPGGTVAALPNGPAPNAAAPHAAVPFVPPAITAEFVESLSDDRIERELLRGELKEREMTYRNRFHSRVVSRISQLLLNWAESAPERGGDVFAGEVGCILRRDPDTLVGIDVAYFSRDVMSRQTDRTTLIEGAPVLAVEVLSPSDRVGDVADKVLEYLSVGIPLVWLVDPCFETIVVHRPDAPPEMFNARQALSGGDALPGLQFAVADVFRS